MKMIKYGKSTLAVGPVVFVLLLGSVSFPRNVLAEGKAFKSLWDFVRAEVTKVVKESIPRYTPPIPTKVVWNAKLKGEFVLDGAVLASVSGNIDGQEGDEVFLVTKKTLYLMKGSTPKPIFVFDDYPELKGDTAIIRPRRTIASMRIYDDGGKPSLFVRLSNKSKGVWIQLREDKFEVVRVSEKIPLCEDIWATWKPGRTYYAANSTELEKTDFSVPKHFYDLHCTDTLVNRDGHPLKVLSVLNVQGLLLMEWVRACENENSECNNTPTKAISAKGQIKWSGNQFEINDYNNDGIVDVIGSSFTVPNQEDKIRVFSFSKGKFRRLFYKTFPFGVASIFSLNQVSEEKRLKKSFAVVNMESNFGQSGQRKFQLWSLN